MRSDPEGAHVGFDPIGLRVMPGTVVRWVVEANVHTATAYHPVNGGHPLRIPEQAEPWDLDYLVEPGQAFEVMLTAEGVYDYFCTPHEVAGMVGRIIVGRPGGPGTQSPGDTSRPRRVGRFQVSNGSWPRESCDFQEPMLTSPAKTFWRSSVSEN